MATVRSKISTAFRLNGLILRSDASKMLLDVLAEVESSELNKWLEKIVEIVQRQSLTSTFVNGDIIEAAINECNQDSDEVDKIFNMIDVFSLPQYSYHEGRKKFILKTSIKGRLHGESGDKNNMFVERYKILYQRAMHHELFTPAPVAASRVTKNAKFSLKPVEYLHGSSGDVNEVIMLGMLTHLREGKYFLEDPSGAVELDLSKAVFHSGLFTENCFVLAEGRYEDEVFHVTALGFPPPEPVNTTRFYFGNINFFGGTSNVCAAASEKLRSIEQDSSSQNNMFVFVSDLWLDQPKVITKFKTLLTGYSQQPPALFVLCGNFLSKPYGSRQSIVLQQKFGELGDIISSFPLLLEASRFVFIPGPQDPGPENILPRPPLSRLATVEIRKKIPFAEFSTNPCRIQYCTQEIIILREDIINKMCRNCLHLPDNSNDIPLQFVKTIIAQAHLCPLPLNIQPVYWGFDNALRLYPLPDLIVCADKYDKYNITNTGTICLNPGSFARSEYCFQVYWPASRQAEDCQIN